VRAVPPLNVSPALERVLARVTEALAEDRHQSAAELIADPRNLAVKREQ
jgi:hypothetical protein